MESLSIELDNGVKAFLAGQSIRGHIKLPKPALKSSINEVTLSLVGRGKVYWTEEPKIIKKILSNSKPLHPAHIQNGLDKGANEKEEVDTEYDDDEEEEEEHGPEKVRDDERYVDLQIEVYESSAKSGEDDQEESEEEISEFPFTLELPEELPSSLQYKFGHVEYYLEGVVTKFTKPKREKTRIFISVNQVLDLNHVEGLDFPRTIGGSEKIISFCGCRRQNLSFSCTIPKLGFVPSEKIPFNIEIVNKTSQVVHTVKVSLHQFLEFRSYPLSKLISGKTRCEETIIAELSGPKVQKSETKSWKTGFIIIPSVPPMSLNGPCHLINISYYLKVRVLGENKLSVTGRVPVSIGTIPVLREKEQHGFEIASFYQKPPKEVSDDEESDYEDEEEEDQKTPKIPLKTLRENFIPSYVKYEN